MAQDLAAYAPCSSLACAVYWININNTVMSGNLDKVLQTYCVVNIIPFLFIAVSKGLLDISMLQINPYVTLH